MKVGEVCNRIVVFAQPGESVRVAARRMRNQHVGDLVVVDEGAEGRTPVGIVTDRDLVMEAPGPLAAGFSRQKRSARADTLGDRAR